MKSNVIYPTFKDAQTLFASYSTLEPNHLLYETLVNTIDSSFINTLQAKNIREIYNSIILKYYPNEMCIKSCFINQILLKSKKHVTIFELPVGNSRVDLCKLNGSSTAYEIKTDLDNLQRLNKQLNDYLEMFEKVFVICSENKMTEIEKSILPSCGIYIYSINKRGTFKFTSYRDASLSQTLNPKKQLEVLRKPELLNYFSPNSFCTRQAIIKYILEKHSPENINYHFKKIIKLRYQGKWDFLQENHNNILEIDYQWFYKHTANPKLIYN